ncbi:MAG: uracil-DNA glycosylase [Anaerovoracaceae bacterium]
MVQFGNDWDEVLSGEFDKDYYRLLRDFLKKEYSSQTIYPSMYDIFNAQKATAYSDVKVVILGQDPYHGPGQAHGMCFSVKKGVAPPPSLVNIFKELESDCGCEIPSHGYLADWAAQGVLLLNTVLTVRGGQPNSHKGMGWEIYTDNVIRKLNERSRPMVFMLWGSNARSKKVYLTGPQHLILEAPHPSPLSAYRGFFGCGHFSKANRFLAEHGMEPVDWQLR